MRVAKICYGLLVVFALAYVWHQWDRLSVGPRWLFRISVWGLFVLIPVAWILLIARWRTHPPVERNRLIVAHVTLLLMWLLVCIFLWAAIAFMSIGGV
jgi:hypothetical protein